MIAVTNGANSRIVASTKNPPSRSIAPNRTRKWPACRPGAPYPNAIVEIRSGNQHSRSANRNWLTNSPPYGYGGRSADMIVLPVRIIMSPTCSSRFLVGRNARSATARTTLVSSLVSGAYAGPGCVWKRTPLPSWVPTGNRRARLASAPESGFPVVSSGRFGEDWGASTDRRASSRPALPVGDRRDRLRERPAPGRRRAEGQLPGRDPQRDVPREAASRHHVRPADLGAQSRPEEGAGHLG